jgi:REP element-mobilizing transposase RayT
MKVFLDDADRHCFMFELAQVSDEYALECLDYCLMDNHFHLAIVNRRRNISAAMQKLKSEYASIWNQKHRRVGHVFEGPFKDQIVQHSLYFKNLTRYIARNPIRAGLVKAPEDWPWSSYRFHAGLALEPPFLAVDRVLQQFHPDHRGLARTAYMAHIASITDAEKEAALFRSRRRVLGDKAFRDSVKGTATAVGEDGASVSAWPSAQFAGIAL